MMTVLALLCDLRSVLVDFDLTHQVLHFVLVLLEFGECRVALCLQRRILCLCRVALLVHCVIFAFQLVVLCGDRFRVLLVFQHHGVILVELALQRSIVALVHLALLGSARQLLLELLVVSLAFLLQFLLSQLHIELVLLQHLILFLHRTQLLDLLRLIHHLLLQRLSLFLQLNTLRIALLVLRLQAVVLVHQLLVFVAFVVQIFLHFFHRVLAFIAGCFAFAQRVFHRVELQLLLHQLLAQMLDLLHIEVGVALQRRLIDQTQLLELHGQPMDVVLVFLHLLAQILDGSVQV
mmetsp:Transcript_45643/g.73039  ORF Transcript_45643/g.73039 Transcript_45643/m.73039 type:complete len:292 (+) Transcript_45643:548-1423(+)